MDSLIEFALLVGQMRDAQRAHFESQSATKVKRMAELEAVVDRSVAAIVRKYDTARMLREG